MSNAISILLVDDDVVDVEMIQRSLKKERISNPIFHAENGIKALEIINDENNEAFKKPYIILLDINMPSMDGHEFLRN